MTSALGRVVNLLPRKSDWDTIRHNPRRNILAGVTVGIVALPLALAFGVSSGMGAQAGLITAIIAGAVAAVFGGSNLQVSGPTGAMTVVLVPVFHSYGVTGVLTVGLLSGIVLITGALLRLGQAVSFIPAPVIEGFTAGIAVVISLQQLPSALGVTGHGDKAWQLGWNSVRAFITHPHWPTLILAGVVLVFMLVGTKFFPKLPFSIVAVILATVIAQITNLNVGRIGALPESIPAPSFGFFEWGSVGTLIPSALAVAALGALESLLSATVADGMTVGHKHDPDRELFGQGLANLISPLFGGMPATGAIARTAVNARSGASSRLSAFVHAIFLALIVYLAAPLVSHIPLAALAGVLLATCVRMVEFTTLKALFRSTRSDALILVLTFVVTVGIDLVTAVAIGMAVAVILALRNVAKNAALHQVPLDTSPHDKEEHDLLTEHIVAYRIDGPLFFATANRFLLELSEISTVSVVILRLSRVTTVDATGAHMLTEAIERLEHRGITVLLSGIHSHHDSVLSTLGVADHLREAGLIFPDTPAAIAHARELVTAQARG